MKTMKTVPPAHQKPVQAEAPVLSRQNIVVQAPLADVWALLTEIDAWPLWQSEISRTHLAGGLAVGSSFRWKTGGAVIRSVLHTVSPMAALGWTGKTLGVSAIHNWTLLAEGDQVTVAVEESMDGLLARLFKKAFQRNLEKGMAHWLKALKSAAERKQ
jgi:hypothetical protein